jgi:hypothetical protein
MILSEKSATFRDHARGKMNAQLRIDLPELRHDGKAA